MVPPRIAANIVKLPDVRKARDQTISRTNNTIIDANTANPIHDDGMLIPSALGNNRG